MSNFGTCFPAAPPEVEGNAETATVVGLFPWTEYEFRVFAANTLGTGEPSSPTTKDKTLEAGEDARVETVPRTPCGDQGLLFSSLAWR